MFEENDISIVGAYDNHIEGLGRQLGVAPAAAMKIAKAAVSQKFQTKGQALLVAKKEDLSPNTLKKWDSGQLKFTDAEYFIRKVITGKSAQLDVFDDTIDKEDGVTNISRGKLPQDINLLVERIELNYDTASGITAKTADFIPVASTDDNALFNGEVEFRVAGNVKFRRPVNSFNQGIPGLLNSVQNGINLKSPILVPSETDIQIVLRFAGTMAGTNAEVIELKLIGTATDKKN